MNTLKGRVTNGKLCLEEPCDLPEGTVVDLVVADPGDDLDDAERAALHSALAASWESAKQGDLQDADEFIRELRKS